MELHLLSLVTNILLLKELGEYSQLASDEVGVNVKRLKKYWSRGLSSGQLVAMLTAFLTIFLSFWSASYYF